MTDLALTAVCHHQYNTIAVITGLSQLCATHRPRGTPRAPHAAAHAHPLQHPACSLTRCSGQHAARHGARSAAPQPRAHARALRPDQRCPSTLTHTQDIPWYEPIDAGRWSLSSFRCTSLGRMVTRNLVWGLEKVRAAMVLMVMVMTVMMIVVMMSGALALVRVDLCRSPRRSST